MASGAAEPSALVGQRLGHYRLTEKIGAGGMGEVYRARDLRLERDVALKVLPPGTLADESARKRFRKEALALSKLNHPNIETVHDFDTQESRDFLVMEYIPGHTLEVMLAAPLPERQIVRLGEQMAEGLAAAHEQGVVHRDLKPANLRVTPDGRLKILDFGLAKMVLEPSPTAVTECLSQTEGAVGTLPYMAPEQLLGEKVDARTDIWAAGAVLYEMATRQRPFRGSGPRLADAILHQAPRAPSTVSHEVSPPLEAIILKCLEKDPGKRYQSAREIAVDLRRLATAPETVTASLRRRWRRWRAPGVAAIAVVIVAGLLLALTPRGIGDRILGRGRAPQNQSLAVLPPAGSAFPVTGNNTIAVLPLQNVSQDPSADYLRFALADETVNVLTHTRSLEVRPLPSSQKYANADLDLAQVGHELRVANLVTGHYIRQGKDLRVTLEVVDVRRNQMAWQGSFVVGLKDMTSLHKQLGAQVREGLLPAVGAMTAPVQSATQPRNSAAYEAYLRSAAIAHDPVPNKEAIALLERAVSLDPYYAPAWEALGRRYYWDATFSGGGQAVFERSSGAYERALALDPNLVTASAHLTENWVEAGQLGKAYLEAQDLVRRRTESAEAHFTLAYVLRYAGLLAESAHECDVALSLDPGNFYFRSCTFAFAEMGETQRAIDYLHLDAGSEFSLSVMPSVLLREGRTADALQALNKMPDSPAWYRGLLQACMESRPETEIARLVGQAGPALMSVRDPEMKYYQASLLAWCGQQDVALKLMRSAVDQNYCATGALNADPLLVKLRSVPAFTSLRQASANCQQKFLAARQRALPKD